MKEFGRYSGVNQRAKKHVAADAGKAVEVGNALNPLVGRWSLVVGHKPVVRRGPCVKRQNSSLS
jgi:hypothetical protein